MICDNCTRSATEPWHGFTRGCPSCEARMVSRSPEAFECRQFEPAKQTPQYMALLMRAGVTHEAVKAASESDAINREKV